MGRVIEAMHLYDEIKRGSGIFALTVMFDTPVYKIIQTLAEFVDNTDPKNLPWRDDEIKFQKVKEFVDEYRQIVDYYAKNKK